MYVRLCVCLCVCVCVYATSLLNFDNISLFDDTCVSVDQNIFSFPFELFSQKRFSNRKLLTSPSTYISQYSIYGNPASYIQPIGAPGDQ